jgi:hypothetical protein
MPDRWGNLIRFLLAELRKSFSPENPIRPALIHMCKLYRDVSPTKITRRETDRYPQALYKNGATALSCGAALNVPRSIF